MPIERAHRKLSAQLMRRPRDGRSLEIVDSRFVFVVVFIIDLDIH